MAVINVVLYRVECNVRVLIRSGETKWSQGRCAYRKYEIINRASF